MRIEKIQIAATKLRQAIRAVTGPTQLPSDDYEVYQAVDAIIDAVVNELTINLRRSDDTCPLVGCRIIGNHEHKIEGPVENKPR